jgi:hypothetical protein
LWLTGIGRKEKRKGTSHQEQALLHAARFWASPHLKNEKYIYPFSSVSVNPYREQQEGSIPLSSQKTSRLLYWYRWNQEEIPWNG